MKGISTGRNFLGIAIFFLSFIFCHTSDDSSNSRPRIIAVTATYARAAQALHVTNVVNVFRLIPPPFLWIVVETGLSQETEGLLSRTAGRCIIVGAAKECTKLNYVHLNDSRRHEDPGVSRGVNQRNSALKYIEEKKIEGIVSFLDDDNIYSPQLFEEFRKVKKVGILPVGFLWPHEFRLTHKDDDNIKPLVQRPIVRRGKDGKPEVYGWETFKRNKWWPELKFQTDMAGFAFNSSLLWAAPDAGGYPKHPIRFRRKLGMLESLFLSLLVASERDLEPLADECQDVHVWHVRFESDWLPYPRAWRVPQPSNLVPGEYDGGYIVSNGTSLRPLGYDADRPPGYY